MADITKLKQAGIVSIQGVMMRTVKVCSRSVMQFYCGCIMQQTNIY